MNDILITDGRVIDPASGLDAMADLAIADGKIVRVGEPGKVSRRARRTLDARGRIVCPGLIDIHVHCREPGHEEEETIATSAAAAVAGGFTTICAMPNTHPPMDDEAAVQYVLQRAAEANLARVLPVGCITKAREGKELAEMGMMLQAGAVAFTDDGDGVASTAVMYRALQYAGLLGVTLMQHCQDPDLSGGHLNSGPVSVRMGMGGIASAGEQIMLRRDLALLERTAARYHMLHVSTADSVRLVREARAAGLPVTAEAAPHHLLLTDAACSGYDPVYKVNPPLRTASEGTGVRPGAVRRDRPRMCPGPVRQGLGRHEAARLAGPDCPHDGQPGPDHRPAPRHAVARRPRRRDDHRSEEALDRPGGPLPLPQPELPLRRMAAEGQARRHAGRRGRQVRSLKLRYEATRQRTAAPPEVTGG